MRVAEAMSRVVLTVGPSHTLRQAAQAMARRGVGAAVVIDPEAHAPGILTERDVLRAVGAGLDPETEPVAQHLTAELVLATPEWSLDRAAEAMIAGGFRHLLVMDAGGDGGRALRPRHRPLLDGGGSAGRGAALRGRELRRAPRSG